MGEKVGEIDLRGKLHPVYDSIKVVPRKPVVPVSPDAIPKYIDDIVQANYLAGRYNKKLKAESVNVATGKAYSNNQILKMLNKHIGDLNIECAPKRKGDVRDTLGDTKRAEDILDFKTETSLKLGLKKTLEWWGLI